MLEFDSTKTYRLADVRTHEGVSKANDNDLYRYRVGLISNNIQVGPFSPCMYMQFVQDVNGKWTNRRLRTSAVQDIREEDGVVEVRTENSIYILEPAELRLPELLDEPEVIELYMSTTAHGSFCFGYYYDADKKPHELVCNVSPGTFQDSCHVSLRESLGTIVCRHFEVWGGIEFYNTIYNQQDYSCRLLIHNVGDETLKVSFERFKADWYIAPGDSRWITPYDKTGADDKYEDEEE